MRQSRDEMLSTCLDGPSGRYDSRMVKLPSKMSRRVVVGLVGALVLAAGCARPKSFEYANAQYATVNALTINCDEPYPMTRDCGVLDGGRVILLGEDLCSVAASEDGAIIMLRPAIYATGAESALNRKVESRSTADLEAMKAILEAQGYTVDDLVAIYSAPLGAGVVSSGSFTLASKLVGFYVFTQPGAYDALLAADAAER